MEYSHTHNTFCNDDDNNNANVWTFRVKHKKLARGQIFSIRPHSKRMGSSTLSIDRTVFWRSPLIYCLCCCPVAKHTHTQAQCLLEEPGKKEFGRKYKEWIGIGSIGCCWHIYIDKRGDDLSLSSSRPKPYLNWVLDVNYFFYFILLGRNWMGF